MNADQNADQNAKITLNDKLRSTWIVLLELDLRNWKNKMLSC